MKMQTSENQVKSSVPVKKEKFQISTSPALFKLLRTSLYPDKIRAVTQEVASNGRDACREMGNPDVPIQVKLPNEIDPTFHVRDYGVGVSPERMSEVFIVYGESTKRGDDLQTGGFGIGAKTPLAYSDQFNIETYYPDEEGQIWRRRYLAAIDNDECGDLIMIGDPEKTDEPRGTKISLTVKPGDEEAFSRNIRRACSAWEPRPRVIGSAEFEWDSYEAFLQGDGWFLLKDRDAVAEDAPLALVDGIPYRLYSRSLLRDDEQYGIDSALSRAFCLPFVVTMGVGEVAVTGSRDAIEYSEQTKKVLRARIIRMMDEVADLSIQKIDNADTLWEAQSIWRNLPHSIQETVEKNTGAPRWKGFRLSSSFSMADANMHFFIYRRGSRDGQVMTKRDKSVYFEIPKRDRMWVHDDTTKQPPRARAMHLFLNNADVNEVRVLMLPEGATLDEPTEGMKNCEKEHGLLTLARDLPAFSTVPKHTRARNARARAQIKRFHSHHGWRPTDEVDFEDKDVVFVQLYRNQAYPLPGREWRNLSIGHLQKELGIVIYGVGTTFIKKVPDTWRWLGHVVEQKWQEVLVDPETPGILVPDIESKFKDRLRGLDRLIKAGKVTLPEGGLLEEWREISLENQGIADKRQKLYNLATLLGKAREFIAMVKTRRYKDYYSAATRAMPFLELHVATESMADEVQWYINQKDGPETLRKANAEDEMKYDEKAWIMHKEEKLSWRDIEEELDLPRHNGNAARRSAMRHQKRLAAKATQDAAEEDAKIQMSAAD